MIIRPYAESDFQGIVKVIDSCITKECWPHYYPQGWSRQRVRSEFNPLKDYKDSIFLVCEDKKRIVGLIAGHDLDSFINFEIHYLKQKFDELRLYHANVFYQRDILVAKSYQKGKVGSKLFLAMQQHASKAGYSKIVTRTPPLNLGGIKFFNKLDYKEILRDEKSSRIYFLRQ